MDKDLKMAELSDVESFSFLFKMMWDSVGPHSERYGLCKLDDGPLHLQVGYVLTDTVLYFLSDVVLIFLIQFVIKMAIRTVGFSLRKRVG